MSLGPYALDEIYCCDCREGLAQLPEACLDSVVTDPPYELAFMGQHWDKTGIAYDVEMWRLVLRALKPGAHLLAFGGTRTHHRMVCAIEDAGFQIRDELQWIFGQGFPKSHDISKGIDKRRATDIEEFAKYIREKRNKAGFSLKEMNQQFEYVAGCNWWEAKGDNFRFPNWDDYQKLKLILKLDDRYDDYLRVSIGEKIGERIRGNAGFSNEQVPRPWKGKIGEPYDITAPATPAAALWQGWGTSLKPACEPICLARKPLSERTVAANVLLHGTGGLNIEASRIGTETLHYVSDMSRMQQWQKDQGARQYKYGLKSGALPQTVSGRWPANVLLDESAAAMLDEQSGEREGCKPHWVEGSREYEGWGSITKAGKIAGFEDFGGASRFFYIAKASPAERDNFVSADPKGAEGCLEGRHDGSLIGPIPRRKCLHPTVKPIELMRYLCRLITPPGGTVLDPFCGSASTLIAAHLEGFHFLGFEKEQKWFELARKRLAQAKAQEKLFP